MRWETSGDRKRDLRRTYPCAQRYAHRRDGASKSAQECRPRRATRTENKQNNEITAKWIWEKRGGFFSFPSVWTVIRNRNRPVLAGSSFWKEPPVPIFTFDTLIFRVIIIIIITKFLRWWDCRINDQVCYGKCCVISIFWYL
jgi:hypothetical protein